MYLFICENTHWTTFAFKKQECGFPVDIYGRLTNVVYKHVRRS